MDQGDPAGHAVAANPRPGRSSSSRSSVPPRVIARVWQRFTIDREAAVNATVGRWGVPAADHEQRQNLDMQRDALGQAGCERIFEEKKSGKARTRRPEFEAALAFLRPDDIPVVRRLDRLGRSLVEMMRTLDALRRDGVRFQSLTEHFDSDTGDGRFALQVHGAMAESFLDLNRGCTMDGLKAALARGRKGGRRKKLTDADLTAAQAMLKEQTISVADIAKRLGVTRTTFYQDVPAARRQAGGA